METGLAQAEELIATVDDRGLFSNDGRQLDSATVGTGIARALYSEDTWSYLTDLFFGLQDDDADPAFLLADDYNDRWSDGTYGSNSNDAYVTTVCVDNDFASDSVSTLERLEEIDRAAPTIGKYFALDDYAVLDAVCDDWPFEPADSPEEYDAEGAAPILVIGTSNDPATPYAWAQSLAAQLDSGVLISVEGEGHTAYNGDNSCVNAVVDSYFLDGTVPSSDPQC
jgi:pimeloyl-ACP methyl ester carboxylesterase